MQSRIISEVIHGTNEVFLFQYTFYQNFPESTRSSVDPEMN